MKRLLFCLFVASVGFADEPALQFTRLDLNDGRSLKNVSIRTFDAGTSRVLLVSDGKATTLPLSLFPDLVGKQISANAPRSGSSTMVAPPAPPPKVRPAAPAPNYAGENDSEHLDAVKLQRERSRHAEAARLKATRYFKYEYNLGSGAVRVRSLDLDATDPEPISGWTGRYRISGRAHIEFFDSRGWSYSRATAAYEVTTETKADGQVVASDLTVKSTATEP